MSSKIRLGLIARADNGGLGTLSWEFATHLKPSKVLIVQNGVFPIYKERYKDFPTRIVNPTHTISKEDQEWLLDDIDVLLSIETFYNWEILKTAKAKGIKTVLLTMLEMSSRFLLEKGTLKPDLFLCPSKLDYQVFPEPKAYLPIPVNIEKLQWEERKFARRFIHVASHGGVNLRKGTLLLLEAMKWVKTNATLTIFSWIPFTPLSSNTEVKVVNFKNYWQPWREGDVLVYPQDYNGICLPVVEALASGLGVITTDIFPFNEFLPKELLFKAESFYKTVAGQDLIEVEAAKISPFSISGKIDEWAGKDISKFSMYGKKWAIENSWNTLLPKYKEILET